MSPVMAKRSMVNGKKARESDGSAEEKWIDLKNENKRIVIWPQIEYANDKK